MQGSSIFIYFQHSLSLLIINIYSLHMTILLFFILNLASLLFQFYTWESSCFSHLIPCVFLEFYTWQNSLSTSHTLSLSLYHQCILHFTAFLLFSFLNYHHVSFLHVEFIFLLSFNSACLISFLCRSLHQFFTPISPFVIRCLNLSSVHDISLALSSQLYICFISYLYMIFLSFLLHNAMCSILFLCITFPYFSFTILHLFHLISMYGIFLTFHLNSGYSISSSPLPSSSSS
jgi:hypothetical protein